MSDEFSPTWREAPFTPPPAAHIRQRGDAMRRRRHLGTALAVAAVLLVVAAIPLSAYYFAAKSPLKNDVPPILTTSSATPSVTRTPTPTPSPTPTPTRVTADPEPTEVVVVPTPVYTATQDAKASTAPTSRPPAPQPSKPTLWTGDHLVTNAAELAKLPIDDPALVAFLRTAIKPDSKGCAKRFRFDKYRSDGWAGSSAGNTGDLTTCGSGGGYYSILKRIKGVYVEVMGTQSPPMCPALEKDRIPRDFAPKCFKDNPSGEAELVDNPFE